MKLKSYPVPGKMNTGGMYRPGALIAQTIVRTYLFLSFGTQNSIFTIFMPVSSILYVLLLEIQIYLTLKPYCNEIGFADNSIDTCVLWSPKTYFLVSF